MAEELPEIMAEGPVAIANCGPAGGVYIADSLAEVDNEVSAAEADNVTTENDALAAIVDLYLLRKGEVTEEEFLARTTAREGRAIRIRQRQRRER